MREREREREEKKRGKGDNWQRLSRGERDKIGFSLVGEKEEIKGKGAPLISQIFKQNLFITK